MRTFLALTRLAAQRQFTYRAAAMAGLATNFFFGLLRAAVMVALYDPYFFFKARIPHINFENESVELGLGKPVGALMLKRILSCKNQEGFFHGIGNSVHRHLPFFHNLKQR